MFFYLSFLRPPPQSVCIASNGKGNSPSKSVEITFTPQIANDLRIAFLEEAIDIFYSWIRVSPPGGPALANGGQPNSITDSFEFMGPKMKLTTWHISSMYKALSVPLPHSAVRGEEWRLALFCQLSTSTPRGSNTSSSKDSLNPVIIDLTKQDLGNLPFPVVSMPIRIENDFSAPNSLKKNEGKGNITPSKNFGKEAGLHTAKQSQIERFYLIPASSVAHILDSSASPVAPVESNLTDSRTPAVICLREDTSFDLDKKIWDSGLMLSSWLSKLFITHEKAGDISNPLKTRAWERIYSGKTSSRIRILELGCGTGIVSICLAALFQRFQSGRFPEVLASDQASAIPIINHNISVNKRAFPSVDIKSLILDWDCDALPPEAAMPFDLVIMADVTYNTASFPSLVRTICNLVKQPPDMASDSETPVHYPYILMAYKQRDEAERSLWGMLEDKGIVLVLIDKITAQCGVKDDCSNSVSGIKVDEEIEIWAWFP